MGVTIPVVAWSTPWTPFGARLQFLGAWPALEAGVNNATYHAGLYNPLVSGQLAWDLGMGWGFSYLLGAYIDYHGPTAWSSTSINQRFALSYTGYDWNLTANVIWGIQLDQVTDRPQVSLCPVSAAFPFNGCNPDFVNVDLTVGKKFGKWQVAWVGYYSTDVRRRFLATPNKASSRWAGSSATISVRWSCKAGSRATCTREIMVGMIFAGGCVSSFHLQACSVRRRPPRP